jgi:hypothetical protein
MKEEELKEVTERELPKDEDERELPKDEERELPPIQQEEDCCEKIFETCFPSKPVTFERIKNKIHKNQLFCGIALDIFHLFALFFMLVLWIFKVIGVWAWYYFKEMDLSSNSRSKPGNGLAFIIFATLPLFLFLLLDIILVAILVFSRLCCRPKNEPYFLFSHLNKKLVLPNRLYWVRFLFNKGMGFSIYIHFLADFCLVALCLPVNFYPVTIVYYENIAPVLFAFLPTLFYGFIYFNVLFIHHYFYKQTDAIHMYEEAKKDSEKKRISKKLTISLGSQMKDIFMLNWELLSNSLVIIEGYTGKYIYDSTKGVGALIIFVVAILLSMLNHLFYPFLTSMNMFGCMCVSHYTERTIVKIKPSGSINKFKRSICKIFEDVVSSAPKNIISFVSNFIFLTISVITIVTSPPVGGVWALTIFFLIFNFVKILQPFVLLYFKLTDTCATATHQTISKE